MLIPNDPHDLRLRGLVSPDDWPNPKPAGRYNLVVVGGGTAGLVAAAIGAGLGGRVALVERELMGGDCLNYGCVPSKALLRTARAVEEAQFGSRSLGLRLESPPTVDFGAVMERMRRLRADIAHHDGAQRFKEMGVDIFLGEGCFAAPDRLEVTSKWSDSKEELRFGRALVATGARPLIPSIDGIDQAQCLTNLNLFALTERPQRMVVVGAGPIGCEMAYAFARFGTEVTVVSKDTQVLPREDPDAAQFVHRSLENAGVKFELGVKLERVEVADPAAGKTQKRVFFSGTNRHGAVEADEILLALGRKPNLDSLGLQEAGVSYDDHGIQVDEYLRTSNTRIYASGDAVGYWQFTHAADAMSRIAVRNALFFGRRKMNSLHIPWCTYTHPEIAHVGLYERDAARAGVELKVAKYEFQELDRAVLDGVSGFAKILYEAKSGKLRGATVVSPQAGEIIGEACLAVQLGLKATDLSKVVHPYPTQGAVWGRLGDNVLREKLNPTLANLLATLLRWRR